MTAMNYLTLLAEINTFSEAGLIDIEDSVKIQIGSGGVLKHVTGYTLSKDRGLVLVIEGNQVKPKASLVGRIGKAQDA